jgi:hypothetical protein
MARKEIVSNILVRRFRNRVGLSLYFRYREFRLEGERGSIIARPAIFGAGVSSHEMSSRSERTRKKISRLAPSKTPLLKRLLYRKPLVKSSGGAPIKRW